ncbi:nicotinamide-nucleotide amidohydrolase family protein [candidate division KSB1 bacterium]
MPENAIVFPNPRGTAPGLLIREEDKLLLMVPGVPMEMRGIISEQMIPYLEERMPDKRTILIRTIRTVGMGESRIAEILDPAVDFPANISIAFLPGVYGVDIRLTGKGRDPERLHKEITIIEEKIVSLFPEIVYGYDDDELEAVVGRTLTEKKLTIAIAESCTGGLIGDTLTSVSGSSVYFDRGYITYSNDAKEELLGVNHDTLIQYGAVSEQVAAEMAEGARKNSKCNIALATTGIAGPTGGTPEKPVGLVYIALSDEFGTVVKKLSLRGPRDIIKKRSARAAINLLRLRLSDKDIYRR